MLVGPASSVLPEYHDASAQAFSDAEASVWVAESDDVPGLVTEAADLEALLSRLRGVIPALLEANGVLPPDGDDVPFRLIARDRTHRPAA